MLDQILNLVKDQAANVITNNSQVPEDKKDAAVETTTHAIADGLKSQLTSGNISNVMALFGGESGGSNALSGSLQNSVVSALAEKVGLSQGVATTIASTVVPALISLVSKKHNDSNDSFDLGSILSSFTGGGDDGKKSGGLMDMIGGLFGGGK
ncbi:hypothetical protein GGR21_002828 [Dysgonomonas hofstadii]|uniref:DUF937 domain-containing protein n=1 Tax=Dysgonomonas hofstadii TaxID=637886 RepID=A0A840CTB5_9BACT|nr:DUF937 domain-containing protein [Dysgonomonas hofstadii]MBB4036914.1 hypothetical protein [Dysgonomonas hofstadii]